MKLCKGNQTFEVNGGIQAAAFKAAGWEEVEPQAVEPEEVEPKPKRTRKAKAEE